MATSKVVLGLIVTNLCSNFGISLFVTCLPTYINDVLDIDIASVRAYLFVLFLIGRGGGGGKLNINIQNNYFFYHFYANKKEW